MDEEWTEVADAAAISESEPTVASVGEAEIALYRVGDDIFATSNICTHAQVQLSDGFLDGYLIECPLHAAQFDIRNGRCMAGPAYVDLQSYDVRLAMGRVQVRPRAAAESA